MTITHEKLYAALGELAITFSNLEHNVLLLLELLTHGDAFLGPIILDRLNLSGTLDRLRLYTKARLRENDDLYERTKTLIKDVDTVRVERNLFIHGQWVIDEYILSNGRVSCFQYKLRFNEDDGMWEYLHDHVFTPNQLAEKTVEISKLRDQAIQLYDDIKDYMDSLHSSTS